MSGNNENCTNKIWIDNDKNENIESCMLRTLQAALYYYHYYIHPFLWFSISIHFNSITDWNKYPRVRRNQIFFLNNRNILNKYFPQIKLFYQMKSSSVHFQLNILFYALPAEKNISFQLIMHKKSIHVPTYAVEHISQRPHNMKTYVFYIVYIPVQAICDICHLVAVHMLSVM